MADILELRGKGLDARYYLEGMPVLVGQRLQLQLWVGQWIAGEFEWDGCLNSRPRLRVRSSLRLSAALSTFFIGPHSLVRWPLGAVGPERRREAAVQDRCLDATAGTAASR